MIDKSVEFYPLTLIKTNTKDYPSCRLPEGYSFVGYSEGDEVRWAEIECSLGQFADVEAGVRCFKREFVDGHNLRAEDRMFFVKDDATGEYVATATLWNGELLGEERQRLHWLAVKDSCAGKGIAKALVCHALDMYNELGYEGFIYLLTATWYYPAVRIYHKFGFEEYKGNKSPSSAVSDEEFKEKNEKALKLISELLS